MKTPTKGTPAVSLRDDPDYREAARKLAELEAAEAELDRRREQINVGLNRASTAGDLTRRARALLEDGLTPRSAEAESLRLRGDLGNVLDQLSVVRRAVELQRRRVDVERERVSRDVCERIRPQYREIVRRIAEALRAAAAALEAEKALRESLVDQGINFAAHIRPMNLFELGLPSDGDSALARWLRDATEAGLL